MAAHLKVSKSEFQTASVESEKKKEKKIRIEFAHCRHALKKQSFENNHIARREREL